MELLSVLLKIKINFSLLEKIRPESVLKISGEVVEKNKRN